MSRPSIRPEHAKPLLEWFATRGGVAIWSSADLSDPSWSSMTPAQDVDGRPTTKPHWKAQPEPRIITDPAEVDVTTWKEVKRFRVGLRRGSQGLKIKLTDAASKRVWKAVAEAGPGATYEFDYETQEAVILAPDRRIPLSDYNPLIH